MTGSTTVDALVIGGGSIGKRHLRNILASGRSAAVVETRADRRTEIAEKSPTAVIHPSLEAALAADRYRAAFICVPTAYHLPPAMACLPRQRDAGPRRPARADAGAVPVVPDGLRARARVRPAGTGDDGHRRAHPAVQHGVCQS